MTQYVSPDFELRDGIATLFVRMGGRLARYESASLATTMLPDLVADGRIDAADARAADDDALADRLLWSSVRRQLLETGPELVHFHHDHLGGLTVATAGGEVVGQRAFGPTGEERAGSFGDVDPYGFTGQERDASTGLVRFQFRSFEPAIGRWISPDPAFLRATPDGIGRHGEAATAYAYVGNHFGDAFDPLGLFFEGAEARGLVKQIRQRAQIPAGRNLMLVRTTAGAQQALYFIVSSMNPGVVDSTAQVSGGTWTHMPGKPADGQQIQTTKPAGAFMPDHTHTEPLFLQHVLDNVPAGSVDTIELSSERPFCSSCGGHDDAGARVGAGANHAGVIEQFHALRPEVEVQASAGPDKHGRKVHTLRQRQHSQRATLKGKAGHMTLRGGVSKRGKSKRRRMPRRWPGAAAVSP